jgi:hypothetical protein
LKKPNPTTAGLAILAGGLSFVGSAQAVDLIINGSFETVAGGTVVANGAHRDGTETGWTGILSSYNYADVYFTGPPIPASENPGSFYSWRHQSAINAYSLFSTPTSDLSYVTIYSLRQIVTLTNAINASDIDSGRGHFTYSAWLASYGTPQQNPEQPYLALRFYDASGLNSVGPDFIFDRTTTNAWIGNAGVSAIVFPPDALTNPPSAGNHHWAKYSRGSIIPQGSRKATVYLTRSPNALLSGSPDTYVDLVKLDVQSVNPQTPVLETAFPPGGATNVAPNVSMIATMRDGTTTVDTNSIRFYFDSVAVTPAIQKIGPVTSVTFAPATTLAGSSLHIWAIAFSDNAVAATTLTNQFQFTVIPAPPPPAYIFPPDHIVVLMDENRAYSEIIGNTNDAPYLNSLLPLAANFTDSHAEQHPTDPNYLYFFSGDNQGITGNSIPTNLPFTTPNLAAQLLNAGYTFVDYAEDLPVTGDTTPVVTGPHGTYYEEENVAGYWISTNQPPPSTNNLPPIVLQPLTNWPSDFRQLPNVAFVHSVEENDMHEGLWPNSSITISNGDFWIRTTLDNYIKWAMTNNSLFIFTYDESSSLSPDNQIPTFFIGPMIRPGNYTNMINHFNVLRTLEDIYHLPYAGAAAAAAPITNIWIQPKLQASLLPNGNFKITWPGIATLQSAPSTLGPFVNVTNGFGPFVTTALDARFYRLRSP